MKCNNCGGHTQFVPAHRYFQCGFCGAHQHPEKSPDGADLIGEDGGLSCSRCQRALVTASIGEWGVLCCEKCRGLFIEQADFPHLIRFERAGYAGPMVPNKADASQQTAPPLPCPKCAQPMERSRYLGPGGVFLDTCGGCARIWLDVGELRNIVRAPGVY